MQRREKKRDGTEELGAYGRIILKLMFKNWIRMCEMNTSGSGKGQLSTFFKHDDECWGSVK
jgi:hypothetical protein